MNNDVKVTLSGVDELTPVLNKLTGSFKDCFGKITQEIVGVTAAWMSVRKAIESINFAAAAQQAEKSFRAVTASFNVNADSMLAKMEELSRGMVDNSDLMQKAVQGFILGLKENQIEGLLDASRSAAKVWGQDVSATFDTLVTAVGGVVRAMGPLVRMGLVTKEEFQNMNQAIGNGAEDLNLYGLVAARAALQAARLSNEELDAKEKTQKFHAAIKEVKETIGVTK